MLFINAIYKYIKCQSLIGTKSGTKNKFVRLCVRGYDQEKVLMDYHILLSLNVAIVFIEKR